MVRTGRPPIPAAERKDVVLRHRLTKAEYRKLSAAAKRAGLSVSEYARKILSEAKP